ncbi:40S ribosomal protein S26 [Thelohanellus kitauei]|uniref:40S ribosomal protein S26 n=1 Tax=Thelohanellus kitauei TaxID=669202 RepID=A0A0C2ITH9_THEKT|nr:40S ribosomal protein S26 [Thelohanellus kitauei]
MTKKRRNGGRSKKNRGHVRSVRCVNCGRCVPKDKAIKKFMFRSVVDSASAGDFRAASFYEGYQFPRFFLNLTYCVSCAVHAKIVHVRSREERKIRAAPKPRFVPQKVEEQNKPLLPNQPGVVAEQS